MRRGIRYQYYPFVPAFQATLSQPEPFYKVKDPSKVAFECRVCSQESNLSIKSRAAGAEHWLHMKPKACFGLNSTSAAFAK